MSDANIIYGYREVPDEHGDMRLEFGPMPAPKSTGKSKGKKAVHTPDPITANPEASAQQLRQFIERIERIETEEREIKLDKKDVYSEAKAMGYDTAQIKKIIAIRRIDPNDRAESEAILETYLSALGLADIGSADGAA